jgi:hypothetical protein
MKKLLSLCCICALLCGSVSAGAAPKAKYTLSPKGTTVLQNLPDRAIVPVAGPSRHALIPGESPTTGLPWEGEYLPMLVHIGNVEGKGKAKGKDVKLAGIGTASPWGIQYADIVYEEILMTGGSTRFAFLFSDSFAQGQPERGVGPVRSTRLGQLLLGEEWQCGLVHAGGYWGTQGWGDHPSAKLLEEAGGDGRWVPFDVLQGSARLRQYRNRVAGVKAPGNLNVDIMALRSLIPASFSSTPRPFLFGDDSPYLQGYASAHTIHLDWGNKSNVSHFQYDEEAQAYLRYCGPGKKEASWAPFSSFAAVDDRSEEHKQLLLFSNVIVQRVSYRQDNSIQLSPLTIGQGNADIFIGGRYIPGYWVRLSLEDATVFYDDQGRELQLLRGKTFIAHFPPEALCAYVGEDGV